MLTVPQTSGWVSLCPYAHSRRVLLALASCFALSVSAVAGAQPLTQSSTSIEAGLVTMAESSAGVPHPRELADSSSAVQPRELAPAESIGGPPAPVPPEVVARDDLGQATVRAIKLTEGIRLDGRLDELVYQTIPAIEGFVQQMPDEGAPGTERTEAWVMFDATHIYVSGRLWDTAPPSGWVANELRRDTSQLRENDGFWVAFDTFYDRRNGVAFYTNPLGALGDFAITNEGNPNTDWNPVWDLRTGRFEGGWTVEMAIPFKSLRYRPGPAQVWGLQIRRTVRRKNELTYLTPVPISVGRRGIFRLSDAATMVGLEVPTGDHALELKTYAISGLTTDVTAAERPGWRRRCGRQVRHYAKFDRGSDVQHRLCPG